MISATATPIRPDAAGTAAVMPVLGAAGHAGAMIALRGGTVGRRFTILYAAVFLSSGAGLLALTFLLSGGRVTRAAPQGNPGAGDTQERIRALQDELSRVQEQQSRQLLIGSLIALVVMAAVSLLLGRVLAGQVLRPLRLITAATRRISADNLDQRLAVSGPADEVRDLADTIDGLLERLEASFAAQRRFAANASHELRTPLTTMRASLDVAVAKPDAARQTVALADRLRTQLDRVDHLLDGFLTLARAQHVAPAGQVDLADLVNRAVRDRAGEVAAKRLSLTADVAPDLAVPGDATLLARAVDNLVDNAVLHNTDGGWIRIAAGRAGHQAQFVVETGGPVLDQRDVDRLGRPFERLGADRTGSEHGSGLGLSIVAAIAAAHGGRLDLLARPAGGLRAEVTVPV
jgi:signal transduction histidine kinase